MEPLIFDTSTILNFGLRDDLEGMLPKLSAHHKLLTTNDVVKELTDPRHREYHDALLMKHFALCNPELTAVGLDVMARLSAVLGRGEVSVIAAAQEIKATAVLDDRAARLQAQQLGVSVAGTLGLIQRCIEMGWLTDVDCIEKVEILSRNGFRIRKPGANESFAEYFASHQ
jgi:predicted nucleic acid-binding protein